MVYFTSCGCIPVVVVSGTGRLFSVVRAYGILSLLDGQRSFIASKYQALQLFQRKKKGEKEKLV